jgi:hypothetical protein
MVKRTGKRTQTLLRLPLVCFECPFQGFCVVVELIRAKCIIFFLPSYNMSQYDRTVRERRGDVCGEA